MGKTFKVTVEEMTPDDDGDLMGKVVAEFMSPGEVLARFVPGTVAEILGAEQVAVTVGVPQGEHVREWKTDALGTPLAPIDSGQPETAEQKQKRKRRTKAEIEADRAAQALGFRDAAHQAEVQEQVGQGPTGDGDADLRATAVYAQNGPADASLPAPAATQPPAVPFNPFQ